MPERRGRSRQYQVGERDPAPEGGLRAFWSGTITFGLVSVPVDLFAAVRPRGGGLRMLDTKGAPLRRQYVCPNEDDEPLASTDLVRGYETEDGDMIVVTDEELEALAPEKTRDIALQQFVDRDDIPPLYFQRAYFLAPTGSSSRAYHLLAETMERSGKAGIATFVMRGKEYLIAILAEGGVLRAETLRFADEIRGFDEVELTDDEAPPDAVERMRKAIRDATTDELDERELRDVRTARLLALVEDKRERGEDVVESEEAAQESSNVIDLMQELKRRLGAERQPLRSASKQQLYDRAKELGISGRSKMNKDELLTAIREAEH